MIFYYCEYKLRNEIRIFIDKSICAILNDIKEDSKYENYHIGMLKIENQHTINTMRLRGHSYLKNDIIKRL